MSSVQRQLQSLDSADWGLGYCALKDGIPLPPSPSGCGLLCRITWGLGQIRAVDKCSMVSPSSLGEPEWEDYNLGDRGWETERLK